MARRDNSPQVISRSTSSSSMSKISIRRGSNEGKRPDDFEDEFQTKKGVKQPKLRPGSSLYSLAHSTSEPSVSSDVSRASSLPDARFNPASNKALGSLETVSEVYWPNHKRSVHRPTNEQLLIEVPVPPGSRNDGVFYGEPDYYENVETRPFQRPLPPPPNPYGAIRRERKERPILPDEPPSSGAVVYTGSEFLPNAEYMKRHARGEIVGEQPSYPLSHKGSKTKSTSRSSTERIINGEFDFLESNASSLARAKRGSDYTEFSTGSDRHQMYLNIGQPVSSPRSFFLLHCCVIACFLFSLAYAGSLPFVVEPEIQTLFKDASSNVTGLFFERLLVPMLIVLLTPMSMFTVPKHPKTVFVTGVVLSGISILCFGFILADSTIEKSLGWVIVLRAIQGFGGSAIFGSSFAIVAFLYGPNLFTATLSLTAITLFAFALGPAFRQLCMISCESLFYWILGSVLILLAPVLVKFLCTLSMIEIHARSRIEVSLKIHLKMMLGMSKVWLVLFCCVVLGVTVGSYFGSLWARLHDATHTGAKIGLLFVFFIACILITLYTSGMVLKLKHEFMLVPILIGAISNFFGIFIFGEFTGLRPELWAYGFLEIFLGIGCSVLAAPLYFELLEISRTQFVPESLQSSTTLAALFVTSLWTGLIFGLILCIYGLNTMGYLASKLIAAGENLIMLLLLIAYIIFRRKKTSYFEWTLAPNAQLREEFIVTQEFFDETCSINTATPNKSYDTL